MTPSLQRWFRNPHWHVEAVAGVYSINANTNLVFTWLRDPRFAPGDPPEATSTFLPVEIVAERGCPEPATPAVESRIEIDLAGGHRLRITGHYDPDALARLIRGLSS